MKRESLIHAAFRTDYKFKSADGHEFSINVCQPVTGETWALLGDRDPNKVGGFTRREHGDFSLGFVRYVVHYFPCTLIMHLTLSMCLQICEYYSRSSGRWPYSDHVEGFAMPYTPAHARCHDDSFQV